MYWRQLARISATIECLQGAHWCTGDATDEEIEFGTKHHIQVIKATSFGRTMPNLHRFISRDNVNPITGEFPKGIEKATRIIVKNSILSLDCVHKKRSEKAVNIGGDLHHAESNSDTYSWHQKTIMN